MKSGFVALIGKPNVGKSTLLNRLVGRKVAITSRRPQTTRRRIIGVVNSESSQMIFVDTPGFYEARHALGVSMLKAAKDEFLGSDLALFLVDARYPPGGDDRAVASFVLRKRKREIPVILVPNKIDLLSPDDLKPREQSFLSLGESRKICPISALTGENLDNLRELILQYLPEGSPQFSPDQFTDLSEAEMIAELIREQAINLTWHEIPHCIAVEIEEIRPGKNPETTYLRATLYVEKESQKAILVGKGGATLKKIGSLSRKGIEQFLRRRVYLDLWVKVKEDWRQRKDVLRAWGYM